MCLSASGGSGFSHCSAGEIRSAIQWGRRAVESRSEQKGRKETYPGVDPGSRGGCQEIHSLSGRKLIHRARIPPVISVQAQRRYKSSSSFLARPILRVPRPPPTTVNSLPKSWLRNLVRTDSSTIIGTLDPTPSLNPTRVSSAIKPTQTITPVPPPRDGPPVTDTRSRSLGSYAEVPHEGALFSLDPKLNGAGIPCDRSCSRWGARNHSTLVGGFPRSTRFVSSRGDTLGYWLR